MITIPVAMNVPLQNDDDGIIRISNTRVTLHTLISTYRLGESPEAIHEGFPTISLADIYAIIAYYLANREVVDAYIQQVNDEAEQIRQEWEARYTPMQKARTEHFRKLLAQKRKEQDS
ncbi:MAG: DUF433 domain-containing protein [Anaerolineae bacterium]|nr:DUF433 domain-containing protein [Anaerolineae bacterium]MDQ7036691.1 DUF433 domain-containing protein [Anaerolineae bacterium]